MTTFHVPTYKPYKPGPAQAQFDGYDDTNTKECCIEERGGLQLTLKTRDDLETDIFFERRPDRWVIVVGRDNMSDADLLVHVIDAIDTVYVEKNYGERPVVFGSPP